MQTVVILGCLDIYCDCEGFPCGQAAGARANLGIKKGRYLYEVKVVEAHNPSEGWGPDVVSERGCAKLCNSNRMDRSIYGRTMLVGFVFSPMLMQNIDWKNYSVLL